jgi:hypothetical protein
MGDIVKHVEQALRDKEWYDIDEQARAAVIATLKYARDHDTSSMSKAASRIVIGHDRSNYAGGPITLPASLAPSIWYAMVSALLNDIEGGAG